MNQVAGSSNDSRKVRFVQLNDRMFTVHGGVSSKNGLRWTSSSSALSDEQKMNDEQRYSIMNHDSQQQQQQVHELADTGQQVSTSLQMSSSSTTGTAAAAAAAAGGGSGSGSFGGGSVTGYSSVGLHSMSTAAATKSSSMTSVSDLVSRSSWSSGQSASVQRAGGTCDATAVAQRMMYRHEVASKQHVGDKVEFEDGLRHLRNLYETQLSASSKSVNNVSYHHHCHHHRHHHHQLLCTSEA